MYLFDYVIVGVGTAGSVLANRLSEDPHTSVLLIEAGPRFGNLPLEMPGLFYRALADRRYVWGYRSDPEEHLDARRLHCPRGRLIGGSSGIDEMVWTRGNPLDYEGWAEQGLAQWSHARCLPYFRMTETFSGGADDYRGGDGPLHVTRARCRNPLARAFLEAGVQAGYPATADVNGFQQEGFGVLDMSVHRGRRWAASRAYVYPARNRPNLFMHPETLAHRILVDGTRATGVEYHRLGMYERVFADREVIVCAGAINSPQLLMLSGIGDADHLREVGVPVVHDLPGVGRNLQDQLEMRVQHECRGAGSLYASTTWLGRARAGLRWFSRRDGDGASNHFEAAGFVRSRAGVAHPNVVQRFFPLAASYDGREWPRGPSFQVSVGLLRPRSRGRVRLRSGAPTEPPSIRFRFLDAEADRRDALDGIRLTREVLAQSALDPFRGPETEPGPQIDDPGDLLAWARARATNAHHAAGTCRMGTGDDAVVDAGGCVHGMQGLRVVDASIMPRLVAGGLDAPVVMMAEKIAHEVLGREPLAPEHAPFFRAPGDGRSQR